MAINFRIVDYASTRIRH